MLLSLVYLVVRVLLRLLAPEGRGEAGKDLEIVVLRHQLNVLRRQVKRPRFRLSDRVLLACRAQIFDWRVDLRPRTMPRRAVGHLVLRSDALASRRRRLFEY